MGKLTMKAIQDTAKAKIFDNILEMANEQGGIQFGNFDVALPVEVETGEGKQEVFVTISLTAKNWKDTKQAEAFNPIEKREEWQAELEIKKQAELLKKSKAKKQKNGEKSPFSTLRRLTSKLRYLTKYQQCVIIRVQKER